MNFEDEEEWDLELLDKLVRSEEQAITARRSTQTISLTSQATLHPPPLSLSLRKADDLQQRLLQAEQQLSDLRKETLQASVVGTSTVEQELHRLRVQIQFKDQEILEARRACTEKSEQLKRVISETEDLRKGFEEPKRVKWQLELTAERKQSEETRETAHETSPGDFLSSPIPGNQDRLFPPWTSHPRSFHGASISNDISSHDREDPSLVRELQIRVLNNGCTSSNPTEIKTCSSKLQKGEQARFSAHGSKIQDSKQTTGERLIVNGSSGHLFSRSLLDIWSPRSLIEKGKGLVSKMLAVCDTDMQVLLSIDKGENVLKQQLNTNMSSCEIDSFISKRAVSGSFEGSVEGNLPCFGAQSLSSILAKVANGLIPSWDFFMAVLELCEVDNMQVSECALRALHCILIHDEDCQNKLFGRNSLKLQLHTEIQKSCAACHGFEASSVTDCRPSVYSSGRIVCLNKTFPQRQTNEHALSYHKDGSLSINDRNSQEKNNSYMECTQRGCSERIFKKVLLKATKGSTQSIRGTAMSIMVLLVMNTEPMRERECFGSTLFDGSIANLLRESGDIDVRLQAVRLVHSLLHCPPVLQKFLLMQEGLNQGLVSKVSKESGGTSDFRHNLEYEGRNAEDDVLLQTGQHMSSRSENTAAKQKSSLEVLEGLMSCLFNVGSSSSQAYLLRRNALRVLTFVATSGQKGAECLMTKETAFVKAGIMKKRSDDRTSSNLWFESLPVRLIALLDQELKAEEEDGGSVMTSTLTEEREHVIHETLALLCRLASHSTQSSNILAAITADNEISRLSLSVTNRLISRGVLTKTARFQGNWSGSPLDMIELSTGLRRRILAIISNM